MKNLLNTEILTRKEVFLVLLWEKLKEIRNTVYAQTGHPEGACSVRNCDEKVVLGGKSETEGKERAKRGQRSKG